VGDGGGEAGLDPVAAVHARGVGGDEAGDAAAVDVGAAADAGAGGAGDHVGVAVVVGVERAAPAAVDGAALDRDPQLPRGGGGGGVAGALGDDAPEHAAAGQVGADGGALVGGGDGDRHGDGHRAVGEGAQLHVGGDVVAAQLPAQRRAARGERGQRRGG